MSSPALAPTRVITFEETQVARYHAFEETASGLTIPQANGINDFDIQFSLPGVIALPAMIYYRTRHTGLPTFSVRVNETTVTRYTFNDNDDPERTWHEIIPAAAQGSPVLLTDNNHLILFARDGQVVFGDIVILYTSNSTTVSVPIVVNSRL